MSETDWLTAWLGEFAADVTEEQRERMLTASARIDALYPERDLSDLREQAFSGAVQVILGDSTLESLSGAHGRAAIAAAQARAALDGGIIAASPSMTDVALAKASMLSRVTVRKVLGR